MKLMRIVSLFFQLLTAIILLFYWFKPWCSEVATFYLIIKTFLLLFIQFVCFSMDGKTKRLVFFMMGIAISAFIIYDLIIYIHQSIDCWEKYGKEVL